MTPNKAAKLKDLASILKTKDTASETTRPSSTQNTKSMMNTWSTGATDQTGQSAGKELETDPLFDVQLSTLEYVTDGNGINQPKFTFGDPNIDSNFLEAMINAHNESLSPGGRGSVPHITPPPGYVVANIPGNINITNAHLYTNAAQLTDKMPDAEFQSKIQDLNVKFGWNVFDEEVAALSTSLEDDYCRLFVDPRDVTSGLLGPLNKYPSSVPELDRQEGLRQQSEAIFK